MFYCDSYIADKQVYIYGKYIEMVLTMPTEFFPSFMLCMLLCIISMEWHGTLRSNAIIVKELFLLDNEIFTN